MSHKRFSTSRVSSCPWPQRAREQIRPASSAASLAPYPATYLAKTYGLQYVGDYLSSAVLSLAGLLATRETKDAIL